MINRLELGKKAEQQACHFLQARGLHLLQQNYRCYFGEIDLIMQDKEDIVFVEVRSRSDTNHGNALESINTNKIKKLMKASVHYLQKKNWLYQVNSRFDIIAIDRKTEKGQLKWIKNAFDMENGRL